MRESSPAVDTEQLISEIRVRNTPQGCADSRGQLHEGAALTHQSSERVADLWIETDHEGRILQCSAGGHTLIGYSKRSARGRLLPILLLENRPTDAQLLHVMFGHSVEREGSIRPKEKGPVRVSYRIALAPSSTASRPVLRWTFDPL